MQRVVVCRSEPAPCPAGHALVPVAAAGAAGQPGCEKERRDQAMGIEIRHGEDRQHREHLESGEESEETESKERKESTVTKGSKQIKASKWSKRSKESKESKAEQGE